MFVHTGSTWHKSGAKVQMRWNLETDCQNKHNLKQLLHILYHFYNIESSNDRLYCNHKLPLFTMLDKWTSRSSKVYCLCLCLKNANKISPTLIFNICCISLLHYKFTFHWSHCLIVISMYTCFENSMKPSLKNKALCSPSIWGRHQCWIRPSPSSATN